MALSHIQQLNERGDALSRCTNVPPTPRPCWSPHYSLFLWRSSPCLSPPPPTHENSKHLLRHNLRPLIRSNLCILCGLCIVFYSGRERFCHCTQQLSQLQQGTHSIQNQLVHRKTNVTQIKKCAIRTQNNMAIQPTCFAKPKLV